MSRGASESVLADLERALCRDRSHTVIEVRPAEPRAPLLRALRERLSSSCRVVHLPANVPEGEICTRILAERGGG